MEISDKIIKQISEEIGTDILVFFHKKTYQVLPTIDIELHWDQKEFWQDVYDEVAKDPNNYLRIEQRDCFNGYDIMQGFARQIKDKTFQNEVLNVLNQRKPFRRFKDLVEQSDYGEAWFKYEKEEKMRYVRAHIHSLLGIDTYEEEDYEDEVDIEEIVENTKRKNTAINYIEFKAHDLEAIKAFYSKAFGWKFTDYGTSYVAFEDSGVLGGFEHTEEPIVNGVLVVLYHEDLEAIKEAVLAAGAAISVDIFSFPGGRRFHFLDPSGNELAIWSE